MAFSARGPERGPGRWSASSAASPTTCGRWTSKDGYAWTTAEVLDRESLWLDHAHCQREFGKWQLVYNHKRPHEALGLREPSSRYRPSTRSYPETLAPEESFYLDDDVLRRVKSKGEITFASRFFYIGSAYVGAPVALRHRGSDVWEVYYCWKRLGIIDLKTNPKKKGRYHSIKAKL